MVLEQELVRAEAESLVAEAQLSNITREKLKQAFNYQFDAIKEHSERIALCASFGKVLLQLLDDSSVTPGETRENYNGYEMSKQIIIDCETALREWNSSVNDKAVLSIRHADDGLEDEHDVLQDEDEDDEEEVLQNGKKTYIS